LTSIPDVTVLVQRLHPDAVLPEIAHPGDAGMDLHSALECIIRPGERTAIPTGIAIGLPPGYAGFVHARSGRALREGLAIVNAPGLIDAGYRGEIKVIATNLDPSAAIHIHVGDRIAQLVIQAVPHVRLVHVEELPGSHRGGAGFGSSGK
jgi:dUTP pyrophosphatase